MNIFSHFEDEKDLGKRKSINKQQIKREDGTNQVESFSKNTIQHFLSIQIQQNFYNIKK